MKSAFTSYARAVLQRFGLYDRVKGSIVYDLFWNLADRRVLDSRIAEVAFYQTVLSGLRPGDVIFDVGANQGSKTDVFVRLGARVIAVEPDPTSQATLRRRFVAWRLHSLPVTIVGKAVSDRHSVETMWVDAPGSAKNTLSRKWVDTLRQDESRFGQRMEFAGRTLVAAVTLEELIANHGVPFFIKIDVEGAEVSVLRGLRRTVPYLSFEVNLPQFLAEGLECIEELARLDPDGHFNYAVDCENGLVLDVWLRAQDFRPVVDKCRDESIEVFWTTVATVEGRSRPGAITDAT